MKVRRIVIIQGHPDGKAPHFCHGLADAYAQAAADAGHEVQRIEVAQLDFPVLRSAAEWESALPKALAPAQAAMRWAEHLVLIFPLWQGTMPALLKAFWEQVLRPGFVTTGETGARKKKGLGGKSARIVVTMGMPGFLYRWYFRAHGVKSLERNILKFCGARPVRETYFGLVDGGEQKRRWALGEMRRLGAAAR
jgi:putative NADPH-quinone reductase